MNNIKKPFESLENVDKNFTFLYGENTENQKIRYEKASEKFKQIYGYDKFYIASSSGRIEVCGNHTDHNGGKVISCAISLDSLCFFMPRNDGIINVTSEGYPQIILYANKGSNEKIGTSSALIRGVVEGFKNNGFNYGGFDAYVTSNVIGGAGISSSASFEVLIAEILNFLYNDGTVTSEEKAKISQFAENVYFGKPSGLLDQTAIAFGGLKILDFSDKNHIKVSDIDNSLSDFTLVLINTGGSHADLTDEYASIPFEMKSVAKAFGKERLVEVDANDFFTFNNENVKKLSDRALLRAIHFFEENQRVDDIYSALKNNDYDTFLNLISESGISSLWKLQNCYVLGSKEQLIPKALGISKLFNKNGANRVHGGGFAGTILNIVKNTELDYFLKNTTRIFGKENVIPLKVRTVGAKVL